ncbi:MAG: esterase family protein [Candidatus Marinimicrobia bacterium]|nr:esterase family protein [Candidatus Neomarinimicrobiota bacterium]
MTKSQKAIALTLLILAETLLSAQLDTISIYSSIMDTTRKAIIVLPEDYFSSNKNFPVVYLLHGWSGCYKDWASHIDMRPLADRYSFMIVSPDGGYAGWYVDSPYDEKSQFETYIAREVPAFIDSHYRTIKDSRGRFVCGLSMGGHGALSLMCKYPDRYSACGSMSGVMSLDRSTKKYGIAKLLGEYEHHQSNWKRNSCIHLIENLKGKNKGIIIDCGIDDPFITGNREIHQKMLKLGIPHDYYERPGGHSWNYWTNALEYHLLFFYKRFHSSR